MTVTDPAGHEPTYPHSQGRSRCNRRSNFGRRRGRRLFGAEAGRLRLLHQQQRASGAESMRELKDRRAAPKGNRNMPRWQL